MSWWDRMGAMLGMATGNVQPEIVQFSDVSCNWVSFPWEDAEALRLLKQSQIGTEHIGELVNMANRVRRANNIWNIPGRDQFPSSLVKKRYTLWSSKPVSAEGFKNSEVGLKLQFNESPVTNLIIGNKSGRTIKVGTSRLLHMGDADEQIYLSRQYTGVEDTAQYHNSHAVYHYACNPVVDYSTPKSPVDKKNLLISQSEKGAHTLSRTKELSNILTGFLDEKILSNAAFIPELNGDSDVKRKKTRSQVWNRFAGVVRYEAVTVMPHTIPVTGDGKYYRANSGVVDWADSKNAPKFKDDSPEALFEIRPAEFTSEEKAAIIMATPTYVLCGMSNPGTDEYSLNKTAGEWSAETEDSSGDNFFAVRDKKNIKENWKKTQPEKDAVTVHTADFGIIGGKDCVYALVNGGESPANNKAGMELFGSDVVSIGAGLKHESRWGSGLVLGTKVVELRHSEKNDDEKESLMSMKSELLELRNKVASLESMIRMDKDGITLQVGGKEKGTEIKITKDKIAFKVQGADLGHYSSAGYNPLQDIKAAGNALIVRGRG
jgi:hypothetical protein